MGTHGCVQGNLSTLQWTARTNRCLFSQLLVSITLDHYFCSGCLCLTTYDGHMSNMEQRPCGRYLQHLIVTTIHSKLEFILFIVMCLCHMFKFPVTYTSETVVVTKTVNSSLESIK